MVACQPFLSDAAFRQLGTAPTLVDILRAISPSKVMQHVNIHFDGSDIDSRERLMLTDILGLQDIMIERLQAFQETVFVLDPLATNPDVSISQLTSLFTSSHIGHVESID